MRNVRTELGRADGNDKELERYYRQLQETFDGTGEDDTIEQKDTTIKGLKDEMSKQKAIIKEKDELNQTLKLNHVEEERKTNEIINLRNRNSYLSRCNEELKEELANERDKSLWRRFLERHKLLHKKSYVKSVQYYSGNRFWGWIKENALFPIGCVIFAVSMFAIFFYFDLIWYIS